MAPEVIRGRHDTKCDVWSAGVLMYYMLAGYVPFEGKSADEGKSDDEVEKKVLKGKYGFESKVIFFML